jgi:hypothetical protein
MTTTTTAGPLEWIRDLLKLMGSRCIGGKYQCPAHGMVGKHSPSLAINERDGRVLIYCHAGCSFDEVFKALELPRVTLHVAPLVDPATWHEEFLDSRTFPKPKTMVGHSPGKRSASGPRKLVAAHPYTMKDDLHTTVAWKLRYRDAAGNKDMRWRSIGPHGSKVPGLSGRQQKDLALYRQRELAAPLMLGDLIVLCESESSVDALIKADLFATTWCGGASDPPLEQLATVLADHDELLIVPDHDDAGLRAGEAMARALPLARTLLGHPGEDARDILERLGQSAFL